jgi:hypothetical protein
MELLDVTPETSRRLRIARGAFRHGVRLQAGAPGPSTRVTSLVALDFAVETTLKAFVQQATSGDLRRVTFPDLVKRAREQLDARNLGGQSGFGGLEEVHDKRNAAQHQARVPTQEELVTGVVHVRDALDDFCVATWDVGFDIAETDEVLTGALRHGLEQAVAAREVDQDATSAVGWVRIVVNAAVEAVTVATAGAIARSGHRTRLPHFSGGGQVEEQLRSLVEALERREAAVRSEIAAVRDAMAPLALGMDTRVWMEFRALLDWAPQRNMAGTFMRHERERRFTAQEARDMTGLAIDLVLRIEEIVGGEIEAPNGVWPVPEP